MSWSNCSISPINAKISAQRLDEIDTLRWTAREWHRSKGSKESRWLFRRQFHRSIRLRTHDSKVNWSNFFRKFEWFLVDKKWSIQWISLNFGNFHEISYEYLHLKFHALIFRFWIHFFKNLSAEIFNYSIEFIKLQRIQFHHTVNSLRVVWLSNNPKRSFTQAIGDQKFRIIESGMERSVLKESGIWFFETQFGIRIIVIRISNYRNSNIELSWFDFRIM